MGEACTHLCVQMWVEHRQLRDTHGGGYVHICVYKCRHGETNPSVMTCCSLTTHEALRQHLHPRLCSANARVKVLDGWEEWEESLMQQRLWWSRELVSLVSEQL